MCFVHPIPLFTQELCVHSSLSRSFVHSLLAHLSKKDRAALAAEVIESPELIRSYVVHKEASHVIRFLIEEGLPEEQATIVKAMLGLVVEVCECFHCLYLYIYVNIWINVFCLLFD
jgi:hypothetical protein